MPIVVVTPSVIALFLKVILQEPHPHVPADHHDPVAYGTEGLILAAVIIATFQLWNRWRERLR